MLHPRRYQRLSFARLARLIQRLDSPAVALLISMVVTLGHRHRLVPIEVIGLVVAHWRVGIVLLLSLINRPVVSLVKSLVKEFCIRNAEREI